MQRNWIAMGAVWTGLAVGLGAFGAHGLKGWTESAEALEWWATASDYHFGHGLGLILLGLFERGQRGAAPSVWPGRCLFLGSLIFSGTLYAMALGGPRVLGAITPIGGTLLIVGWLWLAAQACHSRDPEISA